MLGMNDEFTYFECDNCGCLQLITNPGDLQRYYPADRYYSFQDFSVEAMPRNIVRRWIKKKRDAALLFRRSGLFGHLATRYPNPAIADIQRWMAPTTVRSYAARILDIGCGRGQLLSRLAALGFRSLTGIDPFLSSDIRTRTIRILARPLEAIAGETFDLVMLHHSLEHMSDQLHVFTQIQRLLSDGGVCLIRIPVKSRGAWERYGCDWAEIDAPRHTFLHTEYSLSIVARAAGLYMTHIDYEAEPFAYACSELYRRGIPLNDPITKQGVDWHTVFSKDEIRQFERWAREYNVPGWASRAAFCFSKKNGLTMNAEFTSPSSNAPR